MRFKQITVLAKINLTGGEIMANCNGCPFRWHDSDCEYCSKRGDEIIDYKSYSKSTCPYYREYENSKSSSSSSSSSGSGCLIPIIIIVVLFLIAEAMNFLMR